MIRVVASAVGLGVFIEAVAAQDDRPRQPKGGAERFNPARLIEQFDKNKDGSLGRDEVPQRMKQ